MAQLIEESLLQAIKNDDTKGFNALMETVQCGSYRIGRFPVLSLLYLYKSRKIISVYEHQFLKITNFEVLREPLEVSKKFSDKAGKCLRLFLDETVSPLEMLLILDRTRHLKRVFPMTKPSAAVKERLKSIYSIKYSLKVEFEGDGINIERRPLSYREKKNIAVICLCSFLAVSAVVGASVTAVALKPVEGEVTKLSSIDFNSTDEYMLKRDIVLPANYSVEKVNCNINGNGYKLIFGKGASLGELNGNISDVTIESLGDAIFTSVSENATINNVTVNVSADITVTESSALVVLTNYGTIDGVTVNISGKINAIAPAAEAAEELTFGGIVQNNNYKYQSSDKKMYRGLIKNCTVNYSQFTLVGEVSANAVFGGVAGINNGYLQECTVTGNIVADTFDIAGACTVNNFSLTGIENKADLSQTSTETNWNPISCGIVLKNTYAVENCVNTGRISAISNCGQFDDLQEGYSATASAAGIAYLSSGSTTIPYISGCVNSGNVECSAKYRDAYAAGVCLSSNGEIESCKNTGAVTVKADNGSGAFAGGITTITNGDINKSVNEGAISSTCSGMSYVGGISAYTCASITNCYSGGDIVAAGRDIFVGGIFGFSDVSYAYYIYWGAADKCISECKISVSAIDESSAFVGGIAGFIRQAGLRSDDSVYYFGGRVINCYFAGDCASDVAYYGNIVGAVGAKVYENNSYVSNNTVYHNFENNVYLNNTLKAYGITLTDDGDFVSAEDNGSATSANIEDIKNSAGYMSILNVLKEIFTKD